MDEQKNANQKPLDQKQMSVWIGVSVLAIVGMAVVMFLLYMGAHPQATFLFGAK